MRVVGFAQAFAVFVGHELGPCQPGSDVNYENEAEPSSLLVYVVGGCPITVPVLTHIHEIESDDKYFDRTLEVLDG